MSLRIVEQPVTAETLRDYAEISIAFRVESRLRVELEQGGLGGLRLIEEPVSPPYIKDYDADDYETPASWLRWDTSSWALLFAQEDDARVGGSAIAVHTAGLWFLRGRLDMAALWDLRVAPEARGQGVGTALFARAVEWAQRRGLKHLKIETQNINLAACRFYASQGCYLGGFDRHAYADFPEEVQLIWYYDLT